MSARGEAPRPSPHVPMRLLERRGAGQDDIGMSGGFVDVVVEGNHEVQRSDEHTSELQSLMRISYAVFCLKNKKQNHHTSVVECLNIQIINSESTYTLIIIY